MPAELLPSPLASSLHSIVPLHSAKMKWNVLEIIKSPLSASTTMRVVFLVPKKKRTIRYKFIELDASALLVVLHVFFEFATFRKLSRLSARALQFLYAPVPSSYNSDDDALIDVNDHFPCFLFCSTLLFDFFAVKWEKPGNS